MSRLITASTRTALGSCSSNSRAQHRTFLCSCTVLALRAERGRGLCLSGGALPSCCFHFFCSMNYRKILSNGCPQRTSLVEKNCVETQVGTEPAVSRCPSSLQGAEQELRYQGGL